MRISDIMGVKSKAKKLQWIRMNAQPKKPVLKRYLRDAVLSYPKLMAKDSDTVGRLMILDKGAYIVTKP